MGHDRPSLRSVLWRSLVVTVVTAFVPWLLAAIIPGFSIQSAWDAVLAGFVVGVGNAIIWPAMAFLVVPLSVLTLGPGAIVLNVVFVARLWICGPAGSVDLATGDDRVRIRSIRSLRESRTGRRSRQSRNGG